MFKSPKRFAIETYKRITKKPIIVVTIWTSQISFLAFSIKIPGKNKKNMKVFQQVQAHQTE